MGFHNAVWGVWPGNVTAWPAVPPQPSSLGSADAEVVAQLASIWDELIAIRALLESARADRPPIVRMTQHG